MKYHPFSDAVRKGRLKVTRVNTIEQITDTFTKELAKKPLEFPRGKIMGWPAMLSNGSMNKKTFKYTEKT